MFAGTTGGFTGLRKTYKTYRIPGIIHCQIGIVAVYLMGKWIQILGKINV